MRLKLFSQRSRSQEADISEALTLSHQVLVGTHHKTGTAWMRNIFESICRNHHLLFYVGHHHQAPEKFDVFLQNHSVFDLEEIEQPYKGLHIIRDPRDIVVSGCFYHQKSDEPWLHLPRQKFGGLTYQAKINSYDSMDDRLMFEMENSGFHTIHEILGWEYSNSNFVEVKYEDLIQDINLLLFHQIFTFLGFPGSSIPEILKIDYNHSLLSGQLEST
ncbi:MAG: sulfotransferase domain-containing protein, partial [Cyanobacteria bacterium J06635_10]